MLHSTRSKAAGRLALWCVLPLCLAQAPPCQNTERKDSGGDGCDFYDRHPEYCHCCDTANFSAGTDCCSCKSLPQGDGAWWTAVFNSWPRKATRLELKSRGISGPIPSDAHERWPQLKFLDLEVNKLEGTIPPELGRLSQLENLGLGNNRLDGVIPPELGHLSQLRILSLYGNRLEGAIPPELGRLPQLQEFTLSRCLLQGAIPPELGRLSQLEDLRLEGNQLQGAIPSELGRLSQLKDLQLGNNRLEGAIPRELGHLSQLVRLNLSHNDLGGAIPSELGHPPLLQHLHLQHNRLVGGFPATRQGIAPFIELNVSRNPSLFCSTGEGNISQFTNLQSLALRGCCLKTAPPSLPASLTHLDLGENQLTEVPVGWRDGEVLPVKVLLLDRNNITWVTSAILPLTAWQDVWKWVWFVPSEKPLAWQSLELLDVSMNPLSLSAYDFLSSLSHLRGLVELHASDCNLTGPLPDLFGGKGIVRGHYQLLRAMFGGEKEHAVLPSLGTLNLAGNAISAVQAPPPPRLVRADFSRNALTEIMDRRWWQGGILLAFLDVQDNPQLRVPILLQPGDFCRAGAGGLRADMQGWAKVDSPLAECTTLCVSGLTQVAVDRIANESVLCRCSEGEGNGTSCTACPDHAYSEQSFSPSGFTRRCWACPANALLPGGIGSCFADCSCRAGYYMAQKVNGSLRDAGNNPCDILTQLSREGECRPCGNFKTSRAGSRGEAGCFCNSNSNASAGPLGWGQLLEQQGSCGCANGAHMNFAERRCVPCRAEEDCSDWARSLQPPRVKPGFWAAAPPLEGSDGTFGNFSRHSIWRCDSPSACPGNFSCGWNRTGLACSLCRQGHFRTPSGSCLLCPQAPKDTRLALVGGLLAATPLPVLAHAFLSADPDSRGLIMTLRSFRTSLRQMAKFAQVLAVVAVFEVQWPPLVASIFSAFQSLSFDFASWSGIACLDAQQQQSVGLELVFRWAMPLAAVAVTTLAATAAAAWGCLLKPHRESRLGKLLNINRWEVLRVLVFFLQLFYPTVLKNALLPLSCSPSPTGHLTMNMFPHMICWAAESEAIYWVLAGVGLAYTLSLAVAYPMLLHLARRNTDSGVDQSWWAFIFEDFRPSQRSWVLVAVGKDICLNLVPIMLPGLGTAQLLVTALISTAYTIQVSRSVPFCDVSNSILEGCTSTSVAVLCLFSAGMGFQSEPGIMDLSDHLIGGSSNPLYLQRAVALASLQGLSLLAPALIVGYQLLGALPRTRSLVPHRLQPFTEKERQVWEAKILERQCLTQLDDVEFSVIWSTIAASSAGPNLMGLGSGSSVPEVTGSLAEETSPPQVDVSGPVLQQEPQVQPQQPGANEASVEPTNLGNQMSNVAEV